LKCARCEKPIDPMVEGFYSEGPDNYHERCYAEKRWEELPPAVRKVWLKAMKAQIRAIRLIEDPENRKRILEDYVKRCVPKAAKEEVLGK